MLRCNGARDDDSGFTAFEECNEAAIDDQGSSTQRHDDLSDHGAAYMDVKDA